VCSGAPATCQVASCTDDVQNSSETDVDCGGSCAPNYLCATGDSCTAGSDCTSNICTANLCAAPSGLEVQYRTGDGTSSTDQHLKPFLRLRNTGTTSVAFSTIRIRYWFTKDTGASTFTSYCDYASLPLSSCSEVTLTTGSVSPARTGADSYLDVTFATTKTLAAGATLSEIQTRLNKTDWTSFNEVGDYSYVFNQAAFANSTTITVYMNNVLVWGTEP
jgi:hypothetical protein